MLTTSPAWLTRYGRNAGASADRPRTIGFVRSRKSAHDSSHLATNGRSPHHLIGRRRRRAVGPTYAGSAQTDDAVRRNLPADRSYAFELPEFGTHQDLCSYPVQSS